MAGAIHGMTQEHLAANAAAYDDKGQDQAVAELTNGLRQHLKDLGWGPFYYRIDLKETARDGLRRHRGE